MKLWHLKHPDSQDYEEFLEFVCAAETEQEARMTHPDGTCNYKWNGKLWRDESRNIGDAWPSPESLTVKDLGIANEGISGVVMSRYRAG